MPSPAALLPAWVLLASVLTLAAWGWDKQAARRGASRLPEARLLLYSALGGAPGAWLGVWLFRHKSRKPGFLFRLLLASVPVVAALALTVAPGAGGWGR